MRRAACTTDPACGDEGVKPGALGGGVSGESAAALPAPPDSSEWEISESQLNFSEKIASGAFGQGLPQILSQAQLPTLLLFPAQLKYLNGLHTGHKRGPRQKPGASSNTR